MRAAVLVAVLLAAVQTARADNPVDEARAAYDAGTSEYDLGHYKEALADFENAFRLKHVPALLFNIAQCHRMLGEMKEAATVYRTFISKDPNNSRVEQARTLLAQVEAAVNSQTRAQNARPMGVTAPPEVPRAPDAPRPSPEAQRTVEAPPAAPHVIVPAPAPEPARTVAKTDPQKTPDEVALVDSRRRARAVVPERAIAPKAVASPPPAVERHRVWTWVAAGGAVAAAGAGAAFGLHSKSTQSSLSGSLHTGPEVQSLQAGQQSDAHKANALFLAAGALAVVSVACFALEF